MLIAELHGKTVSECESSEDYLTSAVFGQLRHVPASNAFWRVLFEKAVTVQRGGKRQSLRECLAESGFQCTEIEAMKFHFWPNHRVLGQPDLAIVLERGKARAVVVVEVKLWAPKSNRFGRDQLADYLLLCRRIAELSFGVPPGTQAFLLYLTPRDSTAELEESLARAGSSDDERRLFKLEWNDIILTIDTVSQGGPPTGSFEVLSDVSAFLRRRGLDRFRRFRCLEELESIVPRSLLPSSLMRTIPALGEFKLVESGRWTK